MCVAELGQEILELVYGGADCGRVGGEWGWAFFQDGFGCTWRDLEPCVG